MTENYSSPEDIFDHIHIALSRYLGEYAVPPKTLRRVQLGAGNKLIQGWENLEYPDWDADVGMISYDDGSVSEIVCYNTLDHLTAQQVVATLDEAQRVLCPGGTFTAITPHYSSQLANECLMHTTRYAVDTFRNIFSERQYSAEVDGRENDWKFDIGMNFIFGITERNVFLVTQLVKRDG